MLFSTMKFSIDFEQRNFFRKNKAIEFEELFSTPMLFHLKEGIEKGLSILIPKLTHATSEEIFRAGRDLFRINPLVKKEISHHRLTALLFDLIQEKPLRLGFDQLFPASHKDIYTKLYPNKLPFKNLSCVNNLLCLQLVCISGEGPEPNFPEGDPFPSKPGNGVYFLPDYEIDFEKLSYRKNQTFLLIGYTGLHSQYLFVPEDPQCHTLKKIGFVFGDNLNDNLHPVILR